MVIFVYSKPVGKNTAPCIALSAFHINKIYEDATIAVLLSEKDKLAKTLKECKIQIRY